MKRRNFLSGLGGFVAAAWLPWRKAAPVDESFERVVIRQRCWEPVKWEEIQEGDIIRRMSEPYKYWRVSARSKLEDFLMVEPSVL
jgi:hypothetical protein